MRRSSIKGSGRGGICELPKTIIPTAPRRCKGYLQIGENIVDIRLVTPHTTCMFHIDYSRMKQIYKGVQLGCAKDGLPFDEDAIRTVIKDYGLATFRYSMTVDAMVRIIVDLYALRVFAPVK